MKTPEEQAREYSQKEHYLRRVIEKKHPECNPERYNSYLDGWEEYKKEINRILEDINIDLATMEITDSEGNIFGIGKLNDNGTIKIELSFE